ncbi:MAG: OmpA family protein [Blautia sp.]|nr:OmpA family protein [Blautia sp.]
MKRKKKSEIGGFNIWRSYSDMMAGVLLLFVLIMCVTLFQAQKSYDESLQERDEKIRLQEEYTAELLAQQMELDEKNGQLQTQSEQLDKQQVLLAELAAQLKEQEAKLAAQEAQLSAQQTDLDEKTQLLVSQQQKIDKIIGVKAEVVESLQQEFRNNDVNVNIDAQTGALILDANVMFDVNQSELTDEGRATLAQVLPIYCKVLLQEEHLPYLAEIIIDGYTDNDGDYAYNLELSQRRSLAVADYLLETQYDYLTGDEAQKLEDYLTVNGHSMSNPILDADGNVDKDASRRVEVKFRLKDDEMIDELNSLMSEATEG